MPLSAHDLAMGWITAWISGDLSTLRLADDFTHVSPFGTLSGRDHYLSVILPAYEQNVSRIDFQEILADERRAVLRFIAHGPDGPTPTTEWIYAADGAIQRIESYYDQGAKRLPSGAATYQDVAPPGGATKKASVTSLVPCLWYDGAAEEAAAFYVALFPDAHIDRIDRAPAANPSTDEGAVLTVAFTLAGRPFVALNGGPAYTFSEAISFAVTCADQAEVDRLWDGFVSAGGTPGRCGWLKDRWGVSWQIVPQRLYTLLRDPDADRARRAMEAMLPMGRLNVAALERAADGDTAADKAANVDTIDRDVAGEEA